MKTSKKVLSVILSIVMALSMASVAFAGVLKTESYTSVESLIQNKNLAEVAKSLISAINGKKDDLLPPVLRLLYTFAGDTFGVSGDVTQMSDEALAKALIDWLNKEENLPTWTAGISSNDTVSSILRILRVDLKSVDGVISAIYGLGSNFAVRALMLTMGDARKLKVDNLKGVSTSSKGGNLGVLKAVIAFVNDNTEIISKVLDGSIDLGVLNSLLGDFKDSIGNLPLFLKSYIYQLIDGNAAAGSFDKDANKAKGDWGASPYAGYTADEMLAAALIRLIKDTHDVIPQAEAQEALKLSFYDILATYAGDLYKNYAISAINDNLPKFIQSISVTDELKAFFKAEIPAVDEATVAAIVADAKTTGVLGQVNNLVVKLAELILTPEAYTKLGLTAGGLDKLNENLTKICRTALPMMANDTVKANLGFDFSAFTADKVASMDLKTMAVAVLKLFYKTWFGKNSAYDEKAVADATTLEQLGVLAVYYTATNDDWEWTKNISFDFDHYKDQIFDETGKIKTFAADAAKELAVDMGVGIGAGALKWNGNSTHYATDMDEKGATVLRGDIDGNGKLEAADARLALRIAVSLPNDDVATYYPEVADVDDKEGVQAGDARAILRSAVNLEPITGSVVVPSKFTWRHFVDDISDWGLNYVKGIPAAVKAKGVKTDRAAYDPFEDGVFNKASLVLNQLVNFSFLNNVGSDNYKLDLEKLLFDGLLGNILNFDVAGLLGVFTKNANEGNILNGTFIPSVLGAADRLVSCLFTVQ